ncbi:nitrogen permease regulator 2 [Pseudomassariella vexata]|uniref:Nitrogen permease regulator 2 n=1 Tax=Pseudomassariella vexata TaxID=1141098 RepID=A0A1Y2EAJ9_9PEZI|nr:nitrogen permease regulator 2 [Pseudomassariella vexata]ORY68591.1 nitrogen permease regulator 2 [Pseudomassariella vexata]
MIQGIFYARFLPEEGTKIVAQSPPGCIVASSLTPHLKPPLVDFDIIQEYIIPRKAFFNHFLTVNSPDNKYSILGFPVSIPHERYHRNEFIFNFGLVVEADADQIPYERLVRRLAVTFAEMERQGGYLSSEGKLNDGRRPIESLLEIVKEDLNNYGECMIPVDEANTLNMKLFPYHPSPPPVRGWHVPVPKMKLTSILDPTWDLTLQKLVPHIDGVNDVRRIAWLADVSLPLTQTALQHLLYYDTILLLDMFFFGSCYAPRPGVHDFIENKDSLVDECAGYVCINPTSPVPAATGPSGSSDGGGGHERAGSTGGEAPLAGPQRVSNYQLIKLMTTFCVGRSVMEWIKLHTDAGFPVLQHIDVRRFVQFGVIKGLLYRVHKHVVSKQYLTLLATGHARPLREDEVSSIRPHEGVDGDGLVADPLQRYTDGCHSFDQIITEQNMADGKIMDNLRSFKAPAGDLTVFYR